jgi:hypothetical protein
MIGALSIASCSPHFQVVLSCKYAEFLLQGTATVKNRRISGRVGDLGSDKEWGSRGASRQDRTPCARLTQAVKCTRSAHVSDMRAVLHAFLAPNRAHIQSHHSLAAEDKQGSTPTSLAGVSATVCGRVRDVTTYPAYSDSVPSGSFMNTTQPTCRFAVPPQTPA